MGEGRVQVAVFEVSFESIEAQLGAAWGTSTPRAVLLTGVATKRNIIGIEVRAVNRCEADRPDATGFIPAQEELLLPNHPLDSCLESTVDTALLAESLNQIGLPAEVSTDAGRYLCNGVFFHALEKASKCTPSPPVVFLHLPQVGNPMGALGAEHWTLDALLQATGSVLRHLYDGYLVLKPETQ
jgi:pyroglutamyl-peptidase